MKASKRLLIICLTAVMLVGMTIVTYADGNINYSGGVTDEMNKSEYWYDKTGVVPDQILMTKEEIEDLNKATIAAEGTNMYDLCNIESTYNAAALKTSLASASAGTRKYYVDGMLLDNEQYFGKLKEAIANTGFTDENREVLYAVSTKIANLKGWPTNDIIGYSSDDSDDEIQSAAMCVNEPFVIKQQCIVDGTTFYWGYSANCTGWVCGDSLAVCRTKEEWLDAWKVDVTGSDFLVVTEDKIILDKSVTTPYSSGLELNIGTCLKLVPKELIPDTIGERGTWNNYVVYLPVADENGNYVKKMALIPQHCNVSIGYPLLTQKNILDVAFSCLGNRYGWGGMLNSMDCSLYTRNVYRCFGLEIPRNTTWQKSVPGKSIDL
ncbi:MAG: NlpC/P60 family protein, partial [Lachnospiraceae bacterium]